MSEGMTNLILAIGWVTVVFLGAMGAIILIQMITGKIDLSSLISEPAKPGQDKPEASLSRFQFLVFTFVGAMSLLLVIVSQKEGPAFPGTISPDVLALIGISGGSYLISKGIQTTRDVGLEKEKAKPKEDEAGAGGKQPPAT